MIVNVTVLFLTLSLSVTRNARKLMIKIVWITLMVDCTTMSVIRGGGTD